MCYPVCLSIYVFLISELLQLLMYQRLCTYLLSMIYLSGHNVWNVNYLVFILFSLRSLSYPI